MNPEHDEALASLDRQEGLREALVLEQLHLAKAQTALVDAQTRCVGARAAFWTLLGLTVLLAGCAVSAWLWAAV